MTGISLKKIKFIEEEEQKHFGAFVDIELILFQHEKEARKHERSIENRKNLVRTKDRIVL